MTSPVSASIISGLLWGCLGSWVTQSMFGTSAWFAAPCGILIGLVVYGISRRFYGRSVKALIPVAIVSTFLAVAMFGLCLGFVDLTRDVPNRIAWAVVTQGMFNCLWGLIFVPYYWLLFPLSFGNHALIRRLARHSKANG